MEINVDALILFVNHADIRLETAYKIVRSSLIDDKNHDDAQASFLALPPRM